MVFSQFFKTIKSYSLKNKYSFLYDDINRIFIVFSLFCNLISWLLVIIYLKSLPGLIILSYNVHFGVQLEGQKNVAFILPILGMIIFLFNYVLGLFFKVKYFKETQIIFGTAFFFNLFIVMAVSTLVLINKM